MADSILLVAHGMGVHNAESIRKEVIDAGNTGLHRYERFKNQKFENLVDVKAIDFDDIFETERNLLANQGKGISEYLGEVDGWVADIANSILQLQDDIGKNNFLTTHLLDVLLYTTTHGERVRLRMLERIAAVMAEDENNYSSFHIMAHSLGTAVLHDTLHKAYADGIYDPEDGEYKSLSRKIDSLWMVANVSQLLYELMKFSNVSVNPLSSIVRPSRDGSGCCRQMFNIRHKYDPFTIFHPFNPTENWLKPDIYSSHFTNILTEDFSETLNTHSLRGYLTDPKVSYGFLREILPPGKFAPNPSEKIEADKNFNNLVGEATEIKEFINKMDSVDDINSLLKLIHDFKLYVDDLSESL